MEISEMQWQLFNGTYKKLFKSPVEQLHPYEKFHLKQAKCQYLDFFYK